MPKTRTAAVDEKVYRYLCRFIDQHGYSPTYRNIAAGCRIASTATVQQALRRLRVGGRVDWTDGLTRTITIIGGNK